jgi:hypothetical protein
VLQVAQAIQAQRDNRRISGSPARTNQGQPARLCEQQLRGRVERAHALQDRATNEGTKKQREFTKADVDDVITQLSQRNQSKQLRKPGRRSAGSA